MLGDFLLIGDPVANAAKFYMWWVFSVFDF